LSQAHRSGLIRPQPDVEVAPELDAADAAAEVTRSAEAAVDEPEIDGGLEIGPD
jgi:hypothetical protein